MSEEPMLRCRIPADLKKALERNAESRDLSVSQIVRQLVRDYLATQAQDELFPARKPPKARRNG